MHGYKSVKNLLDAKVTNGSMMIDENTFVAFIDHIGSQTYRAEEICFHDTGENDDVLYKVRGADRYEKFSEIQKRRKGE